VNRHNYKCEMFYWNIPRTNCLCGSFLGLVLALLVRELSNPVKFDSSVSGVNSADISLI